MDGCKASTQEVEKLEDWTLKDPPLHSDFKLGAFTVCPQRQHPALPTPVAFYRIFTARRVQGAWGRGVVWLATCHLGVILSYVESHNYL